MHNLEPLFHIAAISIVQFQSDPESFPVPRRPHPHGIAHQFQVFLPVVHRDGDIEPASLWDGLRHVNLQAAYRDIDGFAANNGVSRLGSSAAADHFNEDCPHDLDALMLASVEIFLRHSHSSQVDALATKYRSGDRGVVSGFSRNVHFPGRDAGELASVWAVRLLFATRDNRTAATACSGVIGGDGY